MNPSNATAAKALQPAATAARGAAAALRVVVAHRPPLVFIREAENGSVSYSGMLIELLPRMLEAARIDRPYQLYQLPSGGGGSLLANGSWSGVMGELTARRADLAMFPLTLTSARSQAISATVPFLDSGYAMLVKITQQDNAYSFLLPFQRDTWLLILAALAAVILTATLLHSWTRRARHAALERQYGLGREAPRRRRHERVMQHGIETTFLLVGQGGAPSSHSWAVKLLYLCWAIFRRVVITLSAYTANLTANLTVSRLGVSIQTLADLKRSGNMFGVPFDSSVSKYFRASNDGVANSLQASMVEYRDQAAAVRDVRSGAIAAYVTDFPVVKGLQQEPPCELTVSRETFGPGQLVVGLQPNSSLQEPLDLALLKMLEDGDMSDLQRKWFVTMSSCGGADSGGDANATAGLGIGSLYTVFVLIAVGIGLAVVYGVCEVLFYKFVFHRLQSIKRSQSVKRAVELFKSGAFMSRRASSLNSDGLPTKDVGPRGADSAVGGGLSRRSRPGGGSEEEFPTAYWAQRIRNQAVPAAPSAAGGGGAGGASDAGNAAARRERRRRGRAARAGGERAGRQGGAPGDEERGTAVGARGSRSRSHGSSSGSSSESDGPPAGANGGMNLDGRSTVGAGSGYGWRAARSAFANDRR